MMASPSPFSYLLAIRRDAYFRALSLRTAGKTPAAATDAVKVLVSDIIFQLSLERISDEAFDFSDASSEVYDGASDFSDAASDHSDLSHISLDFESSENAFDHIDLGLESDFSEEASDCGLKSVFSDEASNYTLETVFSEEPSKLTAAEIQWLETNLTTLDEVCDFVLGRIVQLMISGEDNVERGYKWADTVFMDVLVEMNLRA